MSRDVMTAFPIAFTVVCPDGPDTLGIMPFETFKRQRSKPGSGPEITLQRRGTFSLNAEAFEALGEPEAVELLYDRDERRIGIRKVPTDTSHAYPVRPLNRGRTYLFSGQAFTKWYDIETPVARRWPVTLEGDMLILDLNQPGVEVQSNRAQKVVSAV
jgi:hypothetical protein